MTHEELSRFDGREGRKAYVAYEGTVYDVTRSSFWQDGEHQGMHVAGSDLTEAMQNAPHGIEVFSKFEAVGTLEAETPLSEAPPLSPEAPQPNNATLKEWYQRYHPHPLTVHFPIALHLFAAAWDLLFFINPRADYAVGIFYTFFAATIGGLVAMAAGILSWWINYAFAPYRPLLIKLWLSLLSSLLGIVAIALYLEIPGTPNDFSAASVVYHGIILLTALMVIVIAYFGGTLMWPRHLPHAEEAADAPQTPPMAPAAYQKSSAAFAPPLHHASPDSDAHPGAFALLIGGAAGSGIDTLERLLCHALRHSGYYLFATKEYMSRVRGGSNTTLIRFSAERIEAPCYFVDLGLALDEAALERVGERLKPGAPLCAEAAFAPDGAVILPIRESLGSDPGMRYANSYAAGYLFGMLALEPTALEKAAGELFMQKHPEENLKAVRLGFEAGIRSASLPHPVQPSPPPEAMHLLNGSQAVGYGFLLGGCNVVASYPMSPSTGVLTFIASMSGEFDLIVEQAEDEIAALNMVIGAWYGGGRAATTTSGGGFALMGEALSLAGMSETPAVIYLAQRPGPATGLPTRSEQGDLNLALYSGHGYFPRILLAPGSLRECIDCGYLAFELADRYQVPVIVLSDQSLADTLTLCDAVDFSAYPQERHIIRTEADYRRYEITDDGISPRGIPGYGDGTVCAVSDEHDVNSQITESATVRNAMVEKRRRKTATVAEAALPPEVTGSGEIALVGWGSSRNALREALAIVDDPRLFLLHFFWIYPLDAQHLECLAPCRHVIVAENNVEGQFADLLQKEGITVSHRILRYDGAPFFSDTLADELKILLRELT